MHVEGLKGVRGATGKRTGNREHGEGVSRFSLSFFFFFSLSAVPSQTCRDLGFISKLRLADDVVE